MLNDKFNLPQNIIDQALMKFEKSITIEDLRNNRILIFNWALNHLSYFPEIISEKYPLPDFLIEKFKERWRFSYDDNLKKVLNEEELEIYYLRSVDEMPTYIDGWGNGLSKNKSILWSMELIEKYKDKWDWSSLSDNPSLPWSLDMIEKYEDKWDWQRMGNNEYLPWSIELIEKYKNKWLKREWCGIFLDILNLSESKIGWSKYLPLSIEFIEKFKDLWNWEKLSGNPYFPWSIEFIEKFKDLWNWEKLSGNPYIPWSIDLIEKFKENWTYSSEMDGEILFRRNFCRNTSLPWSTELIEKYKDLLDCGQLCFNNAFPWSVELIDNFKEEGKWFWFGLSENKSVEWSIELIEKYIDKWNWFLLVKNEYIPWSIELVDLLIKYKDKWDYKIWREWYSDLSYDMGRGVKHFIEYEREWWKFIWEELSENKKLPWTVEFIDKYKDLWNWKALSNNESLPWTDSLIEEYLDKWDWGSEKYSEDNKKGLSGNIFLPWTIELIERYIDKWDWRFLSQNESLPWSIQLIEKFHDRWSWICLSGNISLPWSKEFIEFFKTKWYWNYHGLSYNEKIPWSIHLFELYESISPYNVSLIDIIRFKDIYEKIFKPYLTDDLVDEIMRKIIEIEPEKYNNKNKLK